MPSSAHRLLAATAKRMFAVFDWPYADHGSYGRRSKRMSSNITGEKK
jgi:hypothetical protein